MARLDPSSDAYNGRSRENEGIHTHNNALLSASDDKDCQSKGSEVLSGMARNGLSPLVVDNSDSRGISSIQNSGSYTHASPVIITFDDQGFLGWMSCRGLSFEHSERMKSCFSRHFYGKTFNNPVELMTYIQEKKLDINNMIKTARNYLNYLEQSDLKTFDVLTKYRRVLRLRKSRVDFTVPSDEDVRRGFELVKDHKALEIVYLVLATSGIRYGEAMDFLNHYNDYKPIEHHNYVVFTIGKNRGTKNLNNIYLPKFVYEKIHTIENSYKALKTRLKEKGCPFTWKYLRKWHYNFMIYNNVPESVADFVQGRANRSVSSNHYMARSQQAGFWYEKIIEKLVIQLDN